MRGCSSISCGGKSQRLAACEVNVPDEVNLVELAEDVKHHIEGALGRRELIVPIAEELSRIIRRRAMRAGFRS